MQGGDGSDNLIGGLGGDTLLDSAGDDTLKGGDGNDVLSSGQGFGGDLNQGGRGNDFIAGGNDITEAFAGHGDDFVFAGDADDTVFGDKGNDWLEAGRGNFNLLQGDNGAPFQDYATGGHDVLIDYGGEQDYDSEGGDDIIDGDAYLNVRISVRDAANSAVEIESVDTMAGVQARVLAGTINPGQLRIVREILTPANGSAVDTAQFTDIAANYMVTTTPLGAALGSSFTAVGKVKNYKYPNWQSARTLWRLGRLVPPGTHPPGRRQDHRSRYQRRQTVCLGEKSQGRFLCR